MAIIMLAIGSLLAVIGLYAIVSGYPMIEIERGWASVIAGSVLLSGGLVVVALGLVLRALARMRGALPAGTPAVPAAASTEPSLTPLSPTPRVTSPLGVTAPALAVAAPAAAMALAAGYGSRPEAPTPAAPPEPDMAHVPDAPESHAATPGAEPSAEAWDEHAFSAFDYEAEHDVHVAPVETIHAEHAEPPVPPPSDDHGLRADEAIAPAPALHDPATVETDPAEYDLSHPKFTSYADAEHEAEAQPAEPEHAEAAHAEPTHAEPMHAAPAVEPAAEAPATAPDAPPANLSVIGRYDSEGTSYVMYSDGSIEAASEAGVYRFNSMAELKAFIEG